MAKQKGRDFLLKIEVTPSSGTYTTLCGLTSKSLSINTEQIDVTTADCTTPGGVMWREILDGVKTIGISGTGFFEDSTQEARAVAVAMATPNSSNFQLLWPGLGTWTGPFFVDVEGGGEVNGGVTMGVTLASSGTITFAAV